MHSLVTGTKHWCAVNADLAMVSTVTEGMAVYLVDMNLQQLRYLVASADTGSVSGAARVLGVSQPVASRALHALERDLGVELFSPDGRRLALTEAGAAVAEAARRALEAIDEVARTAQRMALGPELVVVATPTNSVLLGPIVAAYMRHRPAVALHLRRGGDMSQVVDMVLSGEADLGFGELVHRPDSGPVESEALWTCEVVIVSPAGTNFPPVVPVKELGGIKLVLPPDGTERRRMINDLVADAGGRQPSAALATDERSAWTASAQRGLASFLSYKAVAVEYEGVELRALAPPIRVPVGFIRPAGGTSAEALDLMDLARECELPTGCAAALPTAVPPDQFR
jgi:LysR family cyn operon transcriptional activator